jgi:hypothetical protein
MRGLFATIVLLLGSVSTFAQPVPVPVHFNEYSAKFLCGEAKGAIGVRPGTYDTSINIHNPQFPLPPPPPGSLGVGFIKKVVRSPREGDAPFPIGAHFDYLLPDAAEQVDCKVIRSLLKDAGTAPFIEGFVVLYVLPDPPPVPHEFDVVGVYTVDTPQGSISLEMVPIAARTVSFPWPEGTRMRDELLQHFHLKAE